MAPDAIVLVVVALNVTVFAVLAATVVPVATPVAVTNIPRSISDVDANVKVVPALGCAALVVFVKFCSVVPRYLCTNMPVPPTVNNSLIFLSKYL